MPHSRSAIVEGVVYVLDPCLDSKYSPNKLEVTSLRSALYISGFSSSLCSVNIAEDTSIAVFTHAHTHTELLRTNGSHIKDRHIYRQTIKPGSRL